MLAALTVPVFPKGTRIYRTNRIRIYMSDLSLPYDSFHLFDRCDIGFHGSP